MSCDLAVDALATARITRLVHADKIAEPFRRSLISWSYGHRPPKGCEALSPLSWPAMDRDPPFIATLVGCRWCLSVWVGFGVVAARRLTPRLWEPVAQALAASYVAAVVQTIED